MIDIQQNRLTDDALAVLSYAQTEAQNRHAIYVDVEHVMLGLLKHQNGTADELLQQYSVDREALYTSVANQIGIERENPVDVKGLTHTTKDALERAAQVAKDLNHSVVDSGHLLVSLLQEPEGIVHGALAATSLDINGARDFMRSTAPPASSPKTGRRKTDDVPPEIIVIPTRKSRQKEHTEQREIPPWVNTLLIIGGIVALIVYMIVILPGTSMLTFVIILGGWIFSLTLHEFSHALVAYWGGDHTVAEKGYLSFNPLKYTHPLLSIVMPLVFLAMGGIGLPGGAVYIERHRLRNKWWGAAVSAAGPISNLIFGLVLGLPFIFGLVDPNTIAFNYLNDFPGQGVFDKPDFWNAIAFLIWLQITAVLFNLLPIPPLDGFGIIEPFLDGRTSSQLRQVGFSGGIFLVFFLFWYVEPVNRAFFDMVYGVSDVLDIPRWMVQLGREAFMFWRDS